MIMKNIETIANSKKYLEQSLNDVDIIEQSFEHSAESSGSELEVNNDALDENERASRYFAYPNNRQVVPPVVIIAMSFQ